LAQELDQHSHLGDRISTAVHFWDASGASEMVLRQRGDALQRLDGVHPKELFPLRLPPKAWRTGALALAVIALCAYHAAYGPPIPQLKESVLRSHALATLTAPLSRALELARSEKKELADLVGSNDRESKASAAQKPLDMPAPGQPTDAAKVTNANPPAVDLGQALQMSDASDALQAKLGSPMQPGQAPGGQASAGAQGAAATDEKASQSGAAGQQSMAQRALQALENLMSSAMSGDQNNSQSTPPSASQSTMAGATGMQAMSGSSQPASSPNQASQGQSSNSQGSQNPAQPMSGKHTGAGNGTTPWQPRTDKDPQLAGNTAKEHVELQTTGFRGAPGKDRADVAPGTAQIPMQDVTLKTVTTVNGAGQDSVPPRYRQYVQDYFQHSEK
jgi:hypothetical protein